LRGLGPSASLLASICASGQPEAEEHASRHDAQAGGGAMDLGVVVTYVDVNRLATWHEVHGSGQPLVLLHGAFAGASSWWVPGTGAGPGRAQRAPDVDGPLTYGVMAGGLVDQLSAGGEEVMGLLRGEHDEHS
jgi:pimeloyl-ACP methyl ester carboxylesterase